MNPPEIIDSARVLTYALVGDCRPSGQTQHLVDGELCPPAKGLVITSYAKDSSCYLGVRQRHASSNERCSYAELEYPGISSKWINAL